MKTSISLEKKFLGNETNLSTKNNIFNAIYSAAQFNFNAIYREKNFETKNNIFEKAKSTGILIF